jgi:hypothetical protein
LKNALDHQSDNEDEQKEVKGMTCGAETVNNNGYPEVKTFLNSLSLQKYEDRFIDNGIEDEETILELGDDHLDQMCVPLGHKLKILKRIKIIR